jgi:cobalamin-dependent methionine synthase I
MDVGIVNPTEMIAYDTIESDMLEVCEDLSFSTSTPKPVKICWKRTTYEKE